MPPENQPSEESFGQRIQRLRRARGLNQRQVAAALGIDFTYLSKLENNRGEPPGEDTIRGLAALLETDEETLMAMAGRVPTELRERARDDVEFARFLRRLPSVPDSKMREIYKNLEIPPADQ
jgi:HTH-type transcriptional regulator, competence development regulator